MGTARITEKKNTFFCCWFANSLVSIKMFEAHKEKDTNE